MEATSPNYQLLKKALECSAKKMIPTYLLCDSKPNRNIDAKVLSIMGCRTRVVDNIFGEKGAIGRGNIANISINLPRLGLEVVNENSKNKYKLFKEKWLNVAKKSTKILLDRYNRLIKLESKDF